MNDVSRSTRRLAARMLPWMACLSILFAVALPARADTPLPRPRITGPTQVNNRALLTLRFTYPPLSWSYDSFWRLWYWSQFWHCEPGRDVRPTDIAIHAQPWAGQTNPCTLENNRYLGLGPTDTGDVIRVPRQGGIPAIGTWYVRTRLVWRAAHGNYQPTFGPWSAWHRVTVVQSFQDAAVPPKILAPADKHLFSRQDAHVRVQAGRRHPNPSRWEYAFEWQRANYHTQADNAFANPHPKPGDFPRVLGLASPFRPWTTGLPVQTLAENAGASTLGLRFADLRSGRHDTSYIYRFRVREQLSAGKAAGPWSEWRSFIVTDPVTLRVMPHPTLHLKRR